MTNPQEPIGGPRPARAPSAPPIPSNLATLVAFGAWVVLGIYALSFLYKLAQDEAGSFGDRFFGNFPMLATGIALCAALLALSVWLVRRGAD
jgi:hypothetical protein